MKRLFAFCAALFLLTASGCAKNDIPVSGVISEPQIQSDLKNYLKSNLDYTPEDIRVVKEDDGSYIVVTSLGSEYSIDDFVPFAEQMVKLSEAAAANFNVTISCVNPTLYTGDNAWIGWSNDSLRFYDQDKYLVENVYFDMLKDEVEKYKIKHGYADSGQELVSASQTMSYSEMKSEIEQYLNNHNDITKMYDSITVGMSNGKVEFNITLPSYETYTFAAVTSAATEIVRTIVEDNDIEEYRLWVHSPSGTSYTISWISFNLDTGLLSDKGYDGDYDEMVKLDFMLERYGYEDYEGSLSDYLNSQSASFNNS